jgi:hypothetical protein
LENPVPFVFSWLLPICRILWPCGYYNNFTGLVDFNPSDRYASFDRGEPNSSFYVIQTNRERIEIIAAIRPSGKRKILG